MRLTCLLSLLAFSAILLVAGCGKEAAPAKEYDIKGKVVRISDDQKAVTLDHEDIPGLMKGMQMKFDVEDQKVLDDIQAGDQVQGRLKVDDGKYVITRLEKQ